LCKLNETYPDLYNEKILKHEGFNNLVETFFKVNEINSIESKILSPKPESETYNEVALAAIQEQEV
jgi:hypothetical protein